MLKLSLADEAFADSMKASGGLVAVGQEESEKLAKSSHESILSMYEPEKQIYGLSMYSQLHCLDVIRKSFYRHQFFPNMTDDVFQFQKSNARFSEHPDIANYLIDDCFDFLRQVIQCHGDISMIYWWNENYTTTLADGTKVHSDLYQNQDLEARTKGAFVFWDVEHSCRETEPIEEWVKQNSPFPQGKSL